MQLLILAGVVVALLWYLNKRKGDELTKKETPDPPLNAQGLWLTSSDLSHHLALEKLTADQRLKTKDPTSRLYNSTSVRSTRNLETRIDAKPTTIPSEQPIEKPAVAPCLETSPSATKTTNIDLSLCFCRVPTKRMEIETKVWQFDPTFCYEPSRTYIDPIQFKLPRPIDICSPITDKKTSLSAQARGLRGNDETAETRQSFLTPFEPIFHAIEYADQHAIRIETLLHNYD
ncbi:unnamed protein product, partial [Mesorhabditis belari]|uniref:Uncharacterized protein n=1 Tax=Mesorhabditis belari TaxID=2138241 RepID=A0AAF3J5W7_9BILA